MPLSTCLSTAHMQQEAVASGGFCGWARARRSAIRPHLQLRNERLALLPARPADTQRGHVQQQLVQLTGQRGYGR